MKREDITGGAAFPQHPMDYPYPISGMTLWDYVAIHAMAGMLAAPERGTISTCADRARIAADRFMELRNARMERLAAAEQGES